VKIKISFARLAHHLKKIYFNWSLVFYLYVVILV